MSFCFVGDKHKAFICTIANFYAFFLFSLNTGEVERSFFLGIINPFFCLR